MKFYAILLALMFVGFTALADVSDEVTVSSQNETDEAPVASAGMYINCDDLHRNPSGSAVKVRPFGVPPAGMSVAEYQSLFQFLCKESGVGKVINKQASLKTTH